MQYICLNNQNLRVWSTVCNWRIRPNFICNINSLGRELAGSYRSCANAKKKSNLSGDKARSFFGYPSFQESLTNQRDSSNLSWSTEDQIHQDSIPIFFCSPKQWLYIHQFSCSLIPEVPTWQICVSSSVLTNMRSLMHKAWQALVLLPLYF